MSREVTYICDCCASRNPAWSGGMPLGWIRHDNRDICSRCHSCAVTGYRCLLQDCASPSEPSTTPTPSGGAS